jgi:hypothetical protein
VFFGNFFEEFGMGFGQEVVAFVAGIHPDIVELLAELDQVFDGEDAADMVEFRVVFVEEI